MEIRLATFNLENLGVRSDGDGPVARSRVPLHLAALRRVILRLEADAVAFQELLDPALLPPLLEGLGYPYRVVGERGSSELQVGIFSRYPLRDASASAVGVDLALVDAKSGIEISARGPFSRPALQVSWEVPGFPVRLIVVHWKSKLPSPTPAHLPGPGDRWPTLGDVGEGRLLTEVKRLAQAVQVRRAVDALLARDPEGRVAVLGDCNDTLESEVLRIVCGDARACMSPGLSPFELVPCELSVPEDLRFTQLYRGRKEMIDHILISQALLPHFRGAAILNEHLREASDDFGPDPYNFGSDHAPVVATFRV